MSVQLQAHFENEEHANLAVNRLRQSGIIFEILDLKPAAARWKADTDTERVSPAATFNKAPEGFVTSYPTGMPFQHMCARAFMATNSTKPVRPHSANETLLRIKVSERSFGNAQRIIRQAQGYGIKVLS
ncbi:MAG TPA: hypothetical protein GXZ65_03280 [Clostridiales bacterium]|jgi:hypothetical protein|nr:hypothetical protein [Clostridiales bacterium]